MKPRRRRSKSVVSKHAHASMTAAGFGHCTKAFEELSSAQIAYGRAKSDSKTLGTARQAFFRRCVVPQR